jgi:phage shock protein C
MTTASTNVFIGRNDTMLGVCEAIGTDFGFNPLWLRLAFAVPMAVVPLWAIGAYLLLGAGVVASRLIAPAVARKQGEVIALSAPTPRAAQREVDFALPLAA